MIKPYSRKLVKVKEEIRKKEAEQEETPINEGGSIRKYERGIITDIKPTKRPLKIKEMQPTSTRDRLDYFIKFDFFK